ncbi:MAG: hypothetical protein AB1847_05285 [bacterium]
MDRQKALPGKKPYLLDLFHTDQPESKSTPGLKGIPGSKGITGSKGKPEKDPFPIKRDKSMHADNEPPSLRLSAFRKEVQTEKIDFVTYTEEISFENFCRYRPDKENR